MRFRIKMIWSIVAFFFAAIDFSFAQSYVIFPNDTVMVYSVFEDLETLTLQQVNNTPDTLHLKWKKVSESVPANWEASVCDNFTCYTSLIDSGSMNPVIPDDYGFVLLHVTAHSTYGTSIIRYAVWDINFPEMKDTLTFILNVNNTGIANANFETPLVWFTENKIHLQNNDENFMEVGLVDMNGKEVFKTKISNRNEFDLPSLATSVYVIQLIRKEKILNRKLWYQN